jgi:ABC-type dipeptide/oligopeptide/nickel transport system permease component
MLSYLLTTVLILGWCFAVAAAWSLALFSWATRRRHGPRAAPSSRRIPGAILPALVVAPVAVLAAFRALGLNLLFPIVVDAELTTLLAATLAPALVLLIASGLAGQLARGVTAELEFWRAKTFATVALAVGRDPHRELRRLVLTKALSGALGRCLPWLFGELVVVEAVFNAPGLGLDAWHLARTRDLAGLATTVAWLTALYIACAAAAAAVHRWIGRRLDSYA